MTDFGMLTFPYRGHVQICHGNYTKTRLTEALLLSSLMLHLHATDHSALDVNICSYLCGLAKAHT